MRKSLQTKVGSPLTRMIIAHNLKNCYARLTPSKKKLLTFLTAVASFKYLHAILHAKLTRSFQGVKKVSATEILFYFEYFQMFCYITTYFLDSISEKKKRVVQPQYELFCSSLTLKRKKIDRNIPQGLSRYS